MKFILASQREPAPAGMNKMESPDTFRRHELKYRLTGKQEDLLKQAMAPYMKGDAFGNSTIYSLYYDTPDHELIRRSMEKPLYKEKLRLRSYGNADPEKPIFIELKKKYDSIVYKRRIAASEEDAFHFLRTGEGVPDSQIAREISHLPQFYPNLEPAMFISYEREAFFSTTDPNFRITFDRNIRFRETDLCLHHGPYGELLLPPDSVILEVKTVDAIPLWLSHFFTENRIFRSSFSKYGTAYSLLNQRARAAS